MKTKSPLLFALATFAVGCVPAAVMLDPTIYNVIDVAASDEDVDTEATGSTPRATLNALGSDLKVVSDWDFPTSGSPEHILSFSDVAYPDVRIRLASGSVSLSEMGLDIPGFSSSNTGTDDFRWNAVSDGAVMEIDFGNYAAGGPLWSGGFNAVSSVGFTLMNIGNAYNSGGYVRADFYTDGGVLLSSQTGTGGFVNPDVQDLYFGYQSGSSNIGYVLVTFERASGGTGAIGLDDLGFTLPAEAVSFSIPEPSVLGFLFLGVVMLRTRRRFARPAIRTGNG